MPRPPGRALPRIAGALTQLSCGACLLVGTIGLVLVEQHRTGGVAPTAAWLVVAMAGLVFGGLVYRGGLVGMVLAAAIDAGFGIVLATFDHDRLRRLLKILPASDVTAIGDALHIAGWVILGAGAICLFALPQGIRYAQWFRDAAATGSAISTARGFPPPPVPARSSAYIIPAEDQPGSRRRLYMVLGGLAVGVGAGVGVLVSSTKPGDAPIPQRGPGAAVVVAGRGSAGSATGAGSPPSTDPQRTSSNVQPSMQPSMQPDLRTPDDAGHEVTGGPGDAGVALADARAATDPTPGDANATLPSIGSVQDLLVAQRRAIAGVDRTAFAGGIAAAAFGFGIDAGEVAEGKDAVIAQLVRDLGDPPPGGFTVASKALAVGEDRGHAWIAEQLDVGGAGRPVRSFAITELAARIDGSWQLVALHWATPVDDATAQRLAILNRLPAPRPIADRQGGAGEIDQAVRAAFGSRAAFAEAFSARPDAFNVGSGGERARGGATIKRIFGKLKAELRIHDGVRVVAGSAWDPAQRSEAWIGWAALNVDFTSKTRAAPDVTQTFRVLAILVKEAHGWKIVQTQWSNGGPLH